jgi:hypothetical protein
MSKTPVDKWRAPQTKRPWYLSATTFRVVALVLRFAMKVIDLFG